MIYLNSSTLIRVTVVFVCIAPFFAFLGCADREIEPRSDVSEEFKKASEALAKAEEAMKKAGISISFSELGALSKDSITDILPGPLDLSQLEKENPELIQDAIASLYEALDAFPTLSIPVSAAPLSPDAEPPVLSKSDLALIHLHLAYLYVLKVVGRLALEGMGPDGQPNTEDDVFMIEFPEEFEEDTAKYKFELTDNGRARIEAIDKLPDPKPEDYLKQFTESERQAIIDSLFLVLGAEVRILPVPSAGIKEQAPKINRTIYRRDALFHLEKAVEQQLEFHSDVKCFTDTLMIAYGEYL